MARRSLDRLERPHRLPVGPLDEGGHELGHFLLRDPELLGAGFDAVLDGLRIEANTAVFLLDLAFQDQDCDFRELFLAKCHMTLLLVERT